MIIASVLHFLFILGEVVMFYNLIICVHELGHFWAARWRGLVVEKFAIWMGPALWKKKVNGVEYCLGSIPIGGYVSLPQMAPMEAIEGKAENSPDLTNLPPITPLDKIIVAVAGPLASFGLALLCACFVFWLGRPVSEGDVTTVIGYVKKGSPAEQGGLLAGDKILQIDGHVISRFMGMGSDAVIWRIVSSEGETLDITVDRQGQILDEIVKPIREPRKFFQRPSLPEIQVAPSVIPLIDQTIPNSPADRAGLKKGDRILAIDGMKLYHHLAISDYLAGHPNQAVSLLIGRGTEQFTVSAKPVVPEGGDHPYLGIAFDEAGETHLDHPLPLEQVRASLNVMVNSLSAVISPKTKIGPQQFSGPVNIMHVYYRLFDSEQAWLRILWFSVLININLAVLNMLPIPVLDGGHILMAILEKIRGRPHNVQILEYLMTGCVALVLGFMLYVSFYDVQDLPFMQKSLPPAPQIKFSAPQP